MSEQVIYLKAYRAGQQIQVHVYAPQEGRITLEIPGNNNLENLGLPATWQGAELYLGPGEINVPRVGVLVNAITEADVFPRELAQLQTVLMQLCKAWPELSVFNWPAGVLKTRRDAMAAFCSTLPGFLTPRCVRLIPKNRDDLLNQIHQEALKWPVLIRAAQVHSGKQLVRLDSPSDAALLDVFSIDDEKVYYVSEFIDYKRQDGDYRKLRLVMIGGQPFLRHQIVGEHWNIHMRTRTDYMQSSASRRADEEAFMARGTDNFSHDVHASLQRLHHHLGLDIYGIDGACLPDGRLLVFEVNPAMEFIVQDTTAYPYLNPHIARIEAAWCDLLEHRSASKPGAL